jgi:hypothetical protein
MINKKDGCISLSDRANNLKDENRSPIDELRSWGWLWTRPVGAKRAVLKSIQACQLAAFGMTLFLLPIIYSFPCTEMQTAFLSTAFTLALLTFFGTLMLQGGCFLSMIMRLQKEGTIGSLSPDTSELFGGIIDRSFSVPANKQQTIERIIATLKGDQCYRITSMDATAGTIRAYTSHNFVKQTDLSFDLTERGEVTTDVRMQSQHSSSVSRFFSDLPISDLPRLLSLEKSVRTGVTPKARNNALFSRHKFLLLAYQKTTVLLVALFIVSSILTNSDSPVSSYSVHDSEQALADSNAELATYSAPGVNVEPTTRAEALTNNATLLCDQLETKALSETGSVRNLLTTSESKSQFHKAEQELKEAAALCPDWSQPFSILARVNALEGNLDRASTLLDKADLLLKKQKAETSDQHGSEWSDELALQHSRALSHFLNNDFVAALAYTNLQPDYYAMTLQEKQLQVKVLKTLGRSNAKLAPALETVRADLKDTRRSTMSSLQQKTSPAFMWAWLSIFAMPLLILSYLLKDWRESPESRTLPPEPKTGELTLTEQERLLRQRLVGSSDDSLLDEHHSLAEQPANSWTNDLNPIAQDAAIRWGDPAGYPPISDETAVVTDDEGDGDVIRIGSPIKLTKPNGC